MSLPDKFTLIRHNTHRHEFHKVSPGQWKWMMSDGRWSVSWNETDVRNILTNKDWKMENDRINRMCSV